MVVDSDYTLGTEDLISLLKEVCKCQSILQLVLNGTG